MLQRFLIIILVSFSSAGVLDQKKILIINNLSESITLDSPLLKNVSVDYPKKINSNDQGIITIDVQKDWWIENPVDVTYKQKIFFKDDYITLNLKKRVPDPSLVRPFEPGYDCEVGALSSKKNIKFNDFNSGGVFCAAFYLY